jgi:glycosyltransferase involved in cell wall biosynthesis
VVKLSIVVPVYNEEGNIEEMIDKTVTALNDLNIDAGEIIAVDDGSKDSSGQILDGLERKYNGILQVIHHGVNKGYADALKTGFKRARYPYIFYTDSDLQFNLDEIRLLLEKKDYDIVCGYRHKRADRWHRIIISGAYNKIISMIFGLNLRDIDCAFKLFKRKIFDEIEIESKGFLVDLEILAKAKKKGFTTTEVPVSHYERKAGSSTVTMKNILETVKGVFWLREKIKTLK